MGDGTYTAGYSVAAPGTVSVSVDLVEAGIKGEYWSNMSRKGSPNFTQLDEKIEFYWGAGNVTPLQQADYVGVKWSGSIYPSTTETYTFYLSSDDNSDLSING